MLRVDSSKPCKIVYAICRHEFLGYLIEPHVVQLNSNGSFSLTYQRLFSNTANEFSNILDETDHKLIKLLEETEQGHIIKRFHKKPIRPVEYFSGIFNEQLYETFRPKIEKKMVERVFVRIGAGTERVAESFPPEKLQGRIGDFARFRSVLFPPIDQRLDSRGDFARGL